MYTAGADGVLAVGYLIIRRGVAHIFHNTDSPAEIDEVRTQANIRKPYWIFIARLLWMSGSAD
jgi:3-methyladenine DNA glycosylase/8-oxoguanine DNA glycosylase